MHNRRVSRRNQRRSSLCNIRLPHLASRFCVCVCARARACVRACFCVCACVRASICLSMTHASFIFFLSLRLFVLSSVCPSVSLASRSLTLTNTKSVLCYYNAELKS